MCFPVSHALLLSPTILLRLSFWCLTRLLRELPSLCRSSFISHTFSSSSSSEHSARLFSQRFRFSTSPTPFLLHGLHSVDSLLYGAQLLLSCSRRSNNNTSAQLLHQILPPLHICPRSSSARYVADDTNLPLTRLTLSYKSADLSNLPIHKHITAPPLLLPPTPSNKKTPLSPHLPSIPSQKNPANSYQLPDHSTGCRWHIPRSTSPSALASSRICASPPNTLPSSTALRFPP